LRILYPEPGDTDIDSELEGYSPFEHPHEKRPSVTLNMVTSLDGRASVKGRSKELGSKVDSELLLKLRTRFDAVMIGAGTMRAERYGRIVRDADARERRERIGLSADPLAVIISSDLALPFDAPLFTDGSGEVLIFTNETSPAPDTETPVSLVTVDGAITMDFVLEYLRLERGIRAVLCEGGPHLFGQLEAADAIDDFFLTISPILVGGEAPRILEGRLDGSRELKLDRLLEAGGELFARYIR